MRLDNVLIRLRDTRVYVDFEKKEVIREYQSKECEYEKVRQVRLTLSAQLSLEVELDFHKYPY